VFFSYPHCTGIQKPAHADFSVFIHSFRNRPLFQISTCKGADHQIEHAMEIWKTSEQVSHSSTATTTTDFISSFLERWPTLRRQAHVGATLVTLFVLVGELLAATKHSSKSNCASVLFLLDSLDLFFHASHLTSSLSQ